MELIKYFQIEIQDYNNSLYIEQGDSNTLKKTELQHSGNSVFIKSC